MVHKSSHNTTPSLLITLNLSLNVRTYILVSACAFDGSWEKAVGIYNRMLLPSYTEQDAVKGIETVKGIATGQETDSSSGQSLKDEKKKEKKEKKEGEGEGVADKEGKGEDKGEGRLDSRTGDSRGVGGGVARDVGTYKALIPILEAASSSSTLPLQSTLTSNSSTPLRSIDDIEKARSILESVRRTGIIEGLMH